MEIENVNEEVEVEVEDILSSSEEIYSSSGLNTIINNIDDLESQLEIIKQVYKRKSFDSFSWDVMWIKNIKELENNKTKIGEDK